MLTLSIPRKIKVCYSCCFKLQIPNLIDQESFLFALFLFSRAHLLSSKMEDKLLVNLLQTSYAPASAERCWWGLLTATLQTEEDLCSASTAGSAQLSACTTAAAAPAWATNLMHKRVIPYKRVILHSRVFLSCGNNAMMVCRSRLEFWGILTQGIVLTRANVSAKDIDWIHSSSISHHLFIMNTLVSI